jgi:hypothetical protein
MARILLVLSVFHLLSTGDAACDVDLTAHGLPACAQACPEWCWATVIGEMKAFYASSRQHADAPPQSPPPATPQCRQDECRVVSDVRDAACCQPSTECAPGAAGGAAGCGNPSSPDEILRGFQREVPRQRWVHLHGRPGRQCTPSDGCYPTEAALQRLLRAGTPVARATHGHITAVAGCRSAAGGGGGAVEYRVLDSLQDPATPLWMNYSLLTVGPPPGQGDGPWQNTYYANTTARIVSAGSILYPPAYPWYA